MKSKQPGEAREALAARLAIIAGLVERFPEWVQWKQDLAWIDGLIAALENDG